MSYVDIWMPPSNVTAHNSEAINAEEQFFVAPPTEIGTVLSASSQIKRGKTPLVFPAPVRVLATVIFALAGCWLTYWVMTDSTNHEDAWAAFIFPPLLGGFGYFLTSRKKYASFVGTEGVYRAAYPAEPGSYRAGELMLFRDAAILKSKQTKQYYNGVYGGTEFNYAWTDAAGKKLLALKGHYRESKLFSRASVDFELAKAAEEAWSKYLVEPAHERWKRGEDVRFPISGNSYVALGAGAIEIARRGKTDRFPVADIGGFGIKDGFVTLRHRDAKSGFLGLGGSGTYTFPYGELANARLFLLLLADLCREEAQVVA